ncbi:uncharacterized protein LOC108098101 isoform X2 [Drosophila ficusphila]|uniref:uncharacterized protein LOC108098101 isoform X2 n=1 Tax=Drosophila ficusphila TaxID=30025 RepID=UPI0007E6AC5F|nr:uncharacterized protein LOC108098101 isoform X2 [Drosophila ficusphila]
MEMEFAGPELLLPSLPASPSRQLLRRRSGRDAVTPRSSAPKRTRLPAPAQGGVAVVRPGSAVSQVRRDREVQRETAAKPPRQMLPIKSLGYSNPYANDPPAKDQRSLTSRSRRAEVKSRNQLHSKPSTTRSAFGGQYTVPQAPQATPFRKPAPPPFSTKKRPSLRSVRAKVDSHLCPRLTGHAPSPPQSSSTRRSGRATKNKSLAEAHQQLELMISRIERASDYQAPPPPPPPKRRGGGITKVAKGARRQMAQPPPVPAGSPIISARSNTVGQNESEDDRDNRDHHLPHVVPLVQNPQRLPPAKRDALLELLQRADQHDKGIVDIVAGSTGDPSRDTMLMLLQMLPLSLNESPYNEKFWEGHRYLKERQKLHQNLRPGDERFKEVKVLRGPDGHVFFSRTLEEELRDEKKVLEYMEAEMRRRGTHYSQPNLLGNSTADRPPLNEREEKAMREREELEQHKQQVANCREKLRQRECKEQLIREQQQAEQPSPREGFQAKNPPTPRQTNPWNQLLQDRDRFKAHCQRSCFYNNSRSSAPWKIYAKVASKLSSQLIESVDKEFHRSVANYINDLVGNKMTQ